MVNEPIPKVMPQAPVVQTLYSAIRQAPVGQTLDGVVHRTNHYPADKYYGNQLRHPLDSDLSGGWRCPAFEQLGLDKSLSSG